MKRCPFGAIVSPAEIEVLTAATEIAVEHVGLLIDSETRPNRKFHDAEYRQRMKALQESLRVYQSALRKLGKVKKPCS